MLGLVDRYVDTECEVHTMLAVAAHLDACPRCATAVFEVRWLKAAVRRCGGAQGLR